MMQQRPQNPAAAAAEGLSVEPDRLTEQDSLAFEKENACAILFKAREPSDRAYAYGAAIRRTLLEETPYAALSPTGPNMAFETNTTMFDNEFLRLRLALVPLSVRPGEIVRISAHPERFRWARGRPAYRLHSKGSADRGFTNVRADALEPVPSRVPPPTAPAAGLAAAGAAGAGLAAAAAEAAAAVEAAARATRATPSDTEDVVEGAAAVAVKCDPVTGAFPLVAKLLTGQELKVSAFVEAGIGRTHAAFSPVGTVSYVPTDRSPPFQIRMVVEMNAAATPSATQYVYDALYWARQRLRDLLHKRVAAYRVARSASDSNSPTQKCIVSLTFDDETSTRAMVVTNELRELFMNNQPAQMAFCAHRVPHPLEGQVEFQMQPTGNLLRQGAEAPSDKDLKQWAVARLHDGIQRAIRQYETFMGQWNPESNMEPTVKDTVLYTN